MGNFYSMGSFSECRNISSTIEAPNMHVYPKHGLGTTNERNLQLYNLSNLSQLLTIHGRYCRSSLVPRGSHQSALYVRYFFQNFCELSFLIKFFFQNIILSRHTSPLFANICSPQEMFTSLFANQCSPLNVYGFVYEFLIYQETQDF